VNVTIPHKQAVIPLLDRLTPVAEAIGSVNTIAMTAEGLLGHSTDGPGFLRALTEQGYHVPGTTAVVLGSGGAARAVDGTLAAAGTAVVTVIARRPAQGEDLPELAARLSPTTTVRIVPWDSGTARAAVEEADLLVNATSVGMAPHGVSQSPVPAKWLHARLWVYDLVYTPRETALLAAAATRGCRTVDGVAMLAYQGAEAFTLWTGHPAPVKVMISAVLRHLDQQAAGVAEREE
jgi:shikimate dehydrogenase